MVTKHEAVKGMEDITITEKVVMEMKLKIEEGVGHLKDRREMTEMGVTVGLGQVLGQVQIETELDAWSVESMIILHENVQLG